MGNNGISIVDDISTIKDAIVLIKEKDGYMLIEADIVIHNLKEGIINAVSGFVRSYKFDADTAYATGKASGFTIYLFGEDKEVNSK